MSSSSSAIWRSVPGRGWAYCTAHLPPAALDGVEHKYATVKGMPLTLVRHDYQSWQRLRSAGLLPPSPLAHYDWPARFRPMSHQIVTSAFLVEHHRAFVLNDVGVGKTHSAIWAADYLRRERAVRRILVIAPLSTCLRTWIPELFGALPADRAICPRGRKNILAACQDPRNTWVIINPENVSLIADQSTHFDLIIVDEFTKFKNVATQRWKSLNRLAQHKRLWLMSGTPHPQSPEDALGPIKLVTGLRLSKNAWRDRVMYPAGPYRWLPRDDAERTITRYMQPAVRFSRDQCIDIPARQTLEITCDLTSAQTRLLKQLEREAVADMEDGAVITAANAAAVLSKTLQVMAGGIYGFDDKGDRITHQVDAEPFFEAIADTVEQASCPVLVFTTFRSCARAIAADLQNRGLRTGLMIGGVSNNKRMEFFQGVQDHTLDVLVAVPGTMEHGITLTRSHVIIWATPPFSVESYIQANGRVERKGQTNKIVVYHIIQNSLARELFKRLNDKQRLQDAVLNMIQRGFT